MTNEELLFFRQITEKIITLIDQEKLSANNNEVDTMKYNGKKIAQRPNGTWWTRYYKNGKQQSVYGKTQQECLEKLKKALKNKDKETNKKETYTLKEWIEQWQKLYKKEMVKESTLHSMNLILSKYVFSNELANKPITKITGLELQEFLNTISALRQREHLYVHLKDIFNKAHINGIIKDNPMRLVVIPKKEKKQRRALTQEEQALLITACKSNPYGNFYKILLFSGMRRGELLALEVSDVNFGNKTITISKTLNDLGKITTTKTGKDRTIPIFNNLETPLKEEIQKVKQGRLFNVTENPVAVNFNRIKKAINVNDVTIHSLRHTFATNCLEAGIPTKQVQQWLGHSNTQITLDTYSHISTKFEEQNTEILNNFLKNDTKTYT